MLSSARNGIGQYLWQYWTCKKVTRQNFYQHSMEKALWNKFAKKKKTVTGKHFSLSNEEILQT